MKKTKAQLEKENKELKEAISKMSDVKSIAEDLLENKSFTTIQDSTFSMKTDIIWDKASVQVMDKVAQALLNLTKTFNDQRVSLDAMVKLDNVNGATISGCMLDAHGTDTSGFKMED